MYYPAHGSNFESHPPPPPNPQVKKLACGDWEKRGLEEAIKT